MKCTSASVYSVRKCSYVNNIIIDKIETGLISFFSPAQPARQWLMSIYFPIFFTRKNHFFQFKNKCLQAKWTKNERKTRA